MERKKEREKKKPPLYGRIARWHMRVGIIFAPFLFITALTAFAMLISQNGAAPPEVAEQAVRLHNWMVIGRYFSSLLALALLFMAASGAYLYTRTWIARRRRERHPRRSLSSD